MRKAVGHDDAHGVHHRRTQAAGLAGRKAERAAAQSQQPDTAQRKHRTDDARGLRQPAYQHRLNKRHEHDRRIFQKRHRRGVGRLERRQLQRHDRGEHRTDDCSADEIAAAHMPQPLPEYDQQHRKAQQKARREQIEGAKRRKSGFRKKISAAARQNYCRQQQLRLFLIHTYHSRKLLRLTSV